jgi:AraC family transcriptional regulator of adaptative response / DNA-3-methyladenine glycosylase II
VTATYELHYREPLPFDALFGFLTPRAIPGVEAVTDSSYVRSVRSGAETAIVELAPTEPGVVRLQVTNAAKDAIPTIVAGARRLLDLDADPRPIGDALALDPWLAPLVTANPGLRVPGAFDGFELAIRAVLGQQISVAAASTLAGRIVRSVGSPLLHPAGPVTHRFPTAAELAAADLGEIGMPARRKATITVVAEAVASGDLPLDGSADPSDVAAQMMLLPGIGPWTAAYVAMRALRDADAMPVGDLGLRRAVAELAGDEAAADLPARAEAWRPWRSYAAMYLWSSLRSR